MLQRSCILRKSLERGFSFVMKTHHVMSYVCLTQTRWRPPLLSAVVSRMESAPDTRSTWVHCGLTFIWGVYRSQIIVVVIMMTSFKGGRGSEVWANWSNQPKSEFHCAEILDWSMILWWLRTWTWTQDLHAGLPTAVPFKGSKDPDAEKLKGPRTPRSTFCRAPTLSLFLDVWGCYVLMLLISSSVLVSVKGVQGWPCNSPDRHRKAGDHQTDRVQDARLLKSDASRDPFVSIWMCPGTRSFQFECVPGPAGFSLNASRTRCFQFECVLGPAVFSLNASRDPLVSIWTRPGTRWFQFECVPGSTHCNFNASQDPLVSVSMRPGTRSLQFQCVPGPAPKLFLCVLSLF